MQISRVIDNDLYPRKALAEARQAYRKFCDFSISALESNQVQVVVIVKPEHEDQGQAIILEFLNYLLDCAAQIHIESE